MSTLFTLFLGAALCSGFVASCRAGEAAQPEDVAPHASSLVVTRDPTAFATLNREFTWELTWRPERTIPAGSQIELRSHNLRTYIEWNYTKFEVEGGATVTWRRGSIASGLAMTTIAENGLAILRVVLSEDIGPAKTLVVRLTATPPYWSNLEDTIGIWIAGPQGDAASTYVGESCASAVLRAGPGPVERLAVYCRPMPNANGKVRTVLAPEDRFGNLSEFKTEIPLQLTWNGKTRHENIKKSEILGIAQGRWDALLVCLSVHQAGQFSSPDRDLPMPRQPGTQ